MNKLKEIREMQHMTQDELSEKSGVTRQTISSIEKDDSYNPTFGTLKKLSDALGRSIADIFLT